jgi:hypothetical protein
VHHTTTATHHTTAPKPAAHPAVRKPAAKPAPHRTLTHHDVAVQHVHASRHADTNRPYTDVLLAAGQPAAVGAGDSGPGTARLISSLIAAALIAIAGVSWAVRRRVVA